MAGPSSIVAVLRVDPERVARVIARVPRVDLEMPAVPCIPRAAARVVLQAPVAVRVSARPGLVLVPVPALALRAQAQAVQLA